MTDNNVTVAPFVPLEPVGAINAPNLTDREAAALLTAINAVRSGISQFNVMLTNKRVSKGKPRIAGEDYNPLAGLSCEAHTGTLVAAPTNKRGEVYLRLADAARGTDENPEGWTAISLAGIQSFRVIGPPLPGPVARAAAEAMRTAVQAVVQAQAMTAQ